MSKMEIQKVDRRDESTIEYALKFKRIHYKIIFMIDVNNANSIKLQVCFIHQAHIQLQIGC
jgi:hypothetical protein